MIDLRRIAGALTAVTLLGAMALPAGAEPANSTDPVPLGTALVDDAAKAVDLFDRQLAMPLRIEHGAAILLALGVLALALAWPLRLWLLARLNARLNRSHQDSALAVYGKAMGAVVTTSILLATAGQIMSAACEAILTLLPASRVIVQSVAAALAIAGFGLGIGRALRSPDDKTRRPVRLPAGLGRVVGFYPFAAGVALGLIGFIDQTSRALAATATSWTIAQGLVVLAAAVVIARFLILAGEARQRQVSGSSTADAAAIPAIFGLTAVAWIALLAGCGAFLLGHPHLSLLILQEMLWAALVLTFAWLFSRFLDGIVAHVLDTRHRGGRFATSVVGLAQARVTQLTLLGSAGLSAAVWLFAILLSLAPLLGHGTGVAEQVQPGPLLRSIRSLNISPRSVGMAALVLVCGIALTRLVRRWLENRFLPATSLDIGARTSLTTGLGYLGVIVALLAATNALGVPFERLTLIASALSVGIGFGLQSIIQNFVSGVILLVERPVKLGDWVSVSGAEGNIRKIKVRATELTTADGGVSVVPNSAFISSTVVNHADRLMASRLDLSLTVTGCASASAARDLLLDLIGSSEAIRHDPRPRLYLRTLDAREWGFDLRIYGREGHSLARAKSDLLFWLSDHEAGNGINIKLA